MISGTRTRPTVKSYDFTRGAETGESGAGRAWEVDGCLLSPIQDETVGDAGRVVVAAYDSSLRTDPVGSR